jgi:D-alanyl-D-alanine carboxypeptidase (penicillin-binding protein 5/6)
MAGTESGFANLMNKAAHELGMQNSSFSDSNGLPSPNHYSTAKDLALLAQAWVRNFPEYYPWFKEKWMSYNGIKQPNRNRLLWRDASVDGFKTGHTDESGYCLIASAMRNNGMRLISVVLGASSDTLRTKYSEALLNYGFRFFETQKIFAANTQLATTKIWLGKQNTVALGVDHTMYVTLPIGQHARLQVKAELIHNIKAPIAKGQVCGNLNIFLDNKVIATQALVALTDIKPANFMFTLFDRIVLLFKHT